MRYLLLFFALLAINFPSFGQNQKKSINYDSVINRTTFINYFIADTVTLNDNWETTNREIPHFIRLKNQYKDNIEIAVKRKKEDQFYATNITDTELLSKDAAFESYRYKVNKDLFEKIYTNDTCYVFNEKKNGRKVTTLVGVKDDYIFELVFYPRVEDKTKNLDYLLALFKNLNIK